MLNAIEKATSVTKEKRDEYTLVRYFVCQSEGIKRNTHTHTHARACDIIYLCIQVQTWHSCLSYSSYLFVISIPFLILFVWTCLILLMFCHLWVCAVAVTRMRWFCGGGRDYLLAWTRLALLRGGVWHYLESWTPHFLRTNVKFRIPVSYTHLDVYKRQGLYWTQ